MKTNLQLWINLLCLNVPANVTAILIQSLQPQLTYHPSIYPPSIHHLSIIHQSIHGVSDGAFFLHGSSMTTVWFPAPLWSHREQMLLSTTVQMAKCQVILILWENVVSPYFGRILFFSLLCNTRFCNQSSGFWQFIASIANWYWTLLHTSLFGTPKLRQVNSYLTVETH